MFDVKTITSRLHLDCGATCLQMLLNYYGLGDGITLTQLARECKTTIIGCTAGDMLRAGKLYGLDLHAYRMSAEELVQQDRPAIIWWKGNHYCVFCGQDDYGCVMIVNPDRGRYRLDYESFASLYSGIALFNGEPHDIGPITVVDKLTDTDEVAAMAYVNSELALALLEMEV